MVQIRLTHFPNRLHTLPCTRLDVWDARLLLMSAGRSIHLAILEQDPGMPWRMSEAAP